MSESKKTQGKERVLRVRVPEHVAEYFDGRAKHYGTSLSAAASPVLCAMAAGEIRNDFTKQPGVDVGRVL